MRYAALAALLLLPALPAGAGAPMSSATNEVPTQSVDTGGGSPESSASNTLNAGANEQTTGISSSAHYKLQSGAWELMSFPNPVGDLSDTGDETISSATLQWTAPGYDGPLGTLQAGSSYYIRVASYTVPSTFSLSFADIVISTSGVSSGQAVSTPAASGLIPNTTYFATLWTLDAAGDASYMSNMSTFTTLALPATPQPGQTGWLEVDFTSVTVGWGALPTSPPNASSMTSEGWVIEASSTNFGALVPGGVISSSATDNVILSTLTISNPPMITNKVYYFRVASINWDGGLDWVVLGSTQTHLQAEEPALTNPTYTAVSSYSITAQWDRNGNATETLYALQTSLSSGFSPATSSTTYNLFASTSGLSANTTYWFQVDASTTGSTSAFLSLGSTVTLTPPPAAAGSPFAGVFQSSMSVVWLANGNAAGVSTYTVVASTEDLAPYGDAGDVSLTTVPAGGTPSATLTGLAVDTTYYLWAESLNWLGAASGWTALGGAATNTGPPSPTSPAFSSVEYSSVDVNWASSDPLGVTTFTVVATTASAYPNADPGNVVLSTVPAGAAPSATVSGLLLDTTYYFFVSATGANGVATAYADVGATATLVALPGPGPSGDFPAVSASDLTAAWSSGTQTPGYDPAGTTYYFQLSLSPTFSPVILQSFELGTSSAVLELSPNTTYYARVAAYDVHDGTWTAFSFSDSTATLAAPPAAAAQSFIDVEQSSMTVAWGADGNPVALTTYTVVLTPQTPYPNSSPLNVFFSTAPAASPSATVTGLQPNTTYYLDVDAQNWAGLATGFLQMTATATYSSPVVSPSTSAVEVSSITVSWTPVTSAGYELTASSTNFGALLPGGAVSLSSTTDPTAGALADYSLVSNTTYYFSVGAFNWYGALTTVQVSSAATLAQPPTGQKFVMVFSTGAIVQWTANPGSPQSSAAEGYEVDAATADAFGNADFGGVLTTSITYNGASTRLEVDNLNPGTTYALRVGSLNYDQVPSYTAIGSTLTPIVPMTWVGGGGNTNWYNAKNWSPNGIPSAGSPVTIPLNVSVVVNASSPSINFSSLTLGSPSGAVSNLWIATGTALTGDVLVYGGAGLTLASSQTFTVQGDMTMLSGSSVTQTAVTTSSGPINAGVYLNVQGTFDLEAGAKIVGTGLGFAGGAAETAGTGPGDGTQGTTNNSGGGGAGHGGAGGAGSSGAAGKAYDSKTLPADPGSGGGGGRTTGVGGAGGGYVNIVASSMTINGSINTNGGSGSSPGGSGGGGSGGAVLLEATYFSGDGVILSTGGPGGTKGGGGGGGIISIDVSGSGNTCDLSFSVVGGTGNATGSSGVVSTTQTLATPSFNNTTFDQSSIQWDWTTVNGGVSYQVFSSTGGNGQSPVLGAGTTYYVETGLLANTTYTRYVVVNACGAQTSSAQQAQTTLAPQPQALAQSFLSIGQISAEVQWAALPPSPPQQTSEGYTLEASSAPDFSASVLSSTTYNAAASTLTLAGLLRNTTYFFRVASLDPEGDPSPWVSLSSASTLAAAPGVPSSVFVDVYFTSVTVQWTGLPPSPPQSQSCEGYIVQASSTDFGALSPAEATFPSSSTYNEALTTLTVSGLDLANTYYFRVGSLNWAGVADTTLEGTLNFEITPDQMNLSFGTINVSGGPTSVVNATPITVTNVGNLPTTLNVWASTETAPSSPWELGMSPGPDVPVLEGLFNTTQPGSGAFSTPITGSTITVNASVMAGNETAVDIPPGQSRTIWFKFFTPTSTSSLSKETIRVEFDPSYP